MKGQKVKKTDYLILRGVANNNDAIYIKCVKEYLTSVSLEILLRYQLLPLPPQKTHLHPVREEVKSPS